VGALLAFLSTSVPRAAAADSASAEAEARALFRKGRELVESGQIAEGCTKFEASLRLYDGLGTRYNLGDCYERIGKLVLAWQNFEQAAAVARVSGDEQRERMAKERAIAVEHRLPRVIVEVDARSRVPGLVLRRNGEVLPPEQWGIAFHIDPGDVALEASAPGHRAWRTEKKALESSMLVVSVPALDPQANEPTPPPKQADSTPLSTSTATSTNGGRILAIGLASAAAVSVGFGSYWGLRTGTLVDRSKPYCNAQDQCSQAGLDLRHDALSNGTRSTVAFVVGGALLLSAAIVWFTLGNRSKQSSSTPVRNSVSQRLEW
jgi:hypothetical protein